MISEEGHATHSRQHELTALEPTFLMDFMLPEEEPQKLPHTFSVEEEKKSSDLVRLRSSSNLIEVR